ncbi:MAG: hypothetical protein KJ645_04110 [Planctomycetes bacterium]|nr:hypothetical protein [Planctomycetota bacterium]
MQDRAQTGKSSILLMALVIGILVVLGALAIFTGIFKQAPLEDPSNLKGNLQDPNIVNVIDDPEPSMESDSKEEEQPMVLRTINEKGGHMYIGAERTKIWANGKEIYTYKIASPTGHKNTRYREKPERKKASSLPKAPNHPMANASARDKRAYAKGEIKVEDIEPVEDAAPKTAPGTTQQSETGGKGKGK